MAVAGLRAAIAWTGLQSRLTRTRRADATAALQRLEIAQARHHALHGRCTDDPRALPSAGVDFSPEGHFIIGVAIGPGEADTPVARAAAGGLQVRDRDCAEITLRVEQGLSQRGPSPACWTR